MSERSRRTAVLIGLAGGVLGFLLMPAVRAITTAAEQRRPPRCYAGVCVGDAEADALNKLSTLPSWRGGWNAIVCFDRSAPRDVPLSELLASGCPSHHYMLVFTDTRAERHLEFDGGRLTRLVSVPTRVVDL